MKTKMQMIILVMSVCIGGITQAKTIRATEMSPDLWSKLMSGTKSAIIEFRQKDKLAINLSVEGDFFEGTPKTTYVTVKTDFWLKFKGSNSQMNVEMSLDGTDYKPIEEVVTGSIFAGASVDPKSGLADGINFVFEAYLR